MVNHFATLLANINLKEYNYILGKYAILTNSQAISIPSRPGAYLALGKTYAYPEIHNNSTELLNREYAKIEIPSQLKNFHNLLFHEDKSIYYNQFLLYCYLKLVDSSMLHEHVKNYDARISYRLDEIAQYFKLSRISEVSSSQTAFKLLVFGNHQISDSSEYPSNTFKIIQVPYSNKVLVYSQADKKYYKYGQSPSSDKDNMEILLSAENSGITKAVNIGSTGLSFRMAGNIGELDNSSEFATSQNKSWNFTVEYSMKFNFSEKFEEILKAERIVEDMLRYSKDICNISYENIWNQHFNSVTRFAGLLMAYVERMHLVWQKRLM